jgi:two-component system chemotaxis sensor kinase CheA
MAKEDEYKELFLAEATESFEQLNTLFIQLEKDIQNKTMVNAIFRITHTLKGNAMGLGFSAIAELSHVVEDIFNELKAGKLKLDEDLFQALYRAVDVLGRLITAAHSGTKVPYKGILTKLKVLLRNAQEETVEPPVDLVEKETTAIPKTEEISTTKVEETVAAEPTIEANIVEDDIVEALSNQLSMSDMVQVPVRKLDELMNIVGELIIEKDRLMTDVVLKGVQSSEMARLHRISSDLQYRVMDVRLVQVGFLFNKFHRIVRDVARIEQKKVNLVLEGVDSEIDRNVLRIISDSLVHLVRNAVSHGIEDSVTRLQSGKPEAGTIVLSARNEKDSVYIDVKDDGNGIDLNIIRAKAIKRGLIDANENLSHQEILMCLFKPGFSNAEKVTEVSGRGVGLDVVKKAIESIGGQISIQSEAGAGTVFSLSLPASMAVKGALLFEVNEQPFGIALSYTTAVVSLRKTEIHKINSGLIAQYLGKTIQLFFLKDLFSLNKIDDDPTSLFHESFNEIHPDVLVNVIVTNYNGQTVGIIVDKLLHQKEIVEKTLPAPVEKVALFSGATILGDGNMCLMINIPTVIGLMYGVSRKNGFTQII